MVPSITSYKFSEYFNTIDVKIKLIFSSYSNKTGSPPIFYNFKDADKTACENALDLYILLCICTFFKTYAVFLYLFK